MSKSETRTGFFGLLGWNYKKGAEKMTSETEGSGQSAERQEKVLRNFSNFWSGGDTQPSLDEKTMKTQVEETTAEVRDSADEITGDAVIEPEGGDIEEVVRRSVIGLLAKFGVPVIVAAAACAVACKMLNN